ncbi:MAG: radical SAM family heme chaperone HemW [Halomonadaceae bacterium]|nr:MAG: radical SAM family heme chaperone HemW [Halomonadaceae bacterium]
MTSNGITAPPLGLYLHTPWCVRKCPYCDFNSHTAPVELPETAYLEALLADLDADLPWLPQQPVTTLFIGGGTPSLMSPDFYRRLFKGLGERLDLSQLGEVTLEANPGTFEQDRFSAYRALGINRLSLGIQSFQDPQLKALGRIHDSANAHQAIAAAQRAGFERINLDLMHGLPGQTPEQAVADLQAALAYDTGHVSWYQLTLEPNTAFYSSPPPLPVEDQLVDIQDAGRDLLLAAGLQNYEISAWSKPGQASQHNLNYWQFGDYLALGAGAHGKVTLPASAPDNILRYWKTRQPEAYLQRIGSRTAGRQGITTGDLPLEFMMNALRLQDGVPSKLFSERTGLPLSAIMGILNDLVQEQLLEPMEKRQRLAPTEKGHRFLNDVLERFMV